ncbi:kinetochore protein Spc25-like [Physella acuta]|uniref:kinetochore protein Spc25-like n=1 Tax=Physella acuta TaxID=109671 RepID=UPI0027DE969B|nr:kinetochore protein Spc25-like [Physella acuta]XP_059172787.1 kinetochore protein Spc25-like [Physella acuta]
MDTTVQLNQLKQHVTKWLQAEKENIEKLYDKKFKDIETNNKKIQDLKMQKKLRQKVSKEAAQNNLQLMKSLKSELELKRTQQFANELMIKAYQEELEHLQSEQKAFTDSNDLDNKQKHLEEEKDLFSKVYGLQIIKVKGGWLQFIFTQIDPSDPQSRFLFSLKLDDYRRYIGGDCQPLINDFEDLIKKLNSTNNLGMFVHSIREKFKQSI